MGSSYWSDDFYRDRAADKAAKNIPTFKYDADVRAGRTEKKVHPTLDILDKIRESRDSKEHPNSVAIAVVFDVTGSMAGVPRVMQQKLPQLMGLLLRKDYVKDPQVLFGAVGDFFSDRVPLQIGQFESGIEMDDNLTNMVLEGGGGGSYQESYQDALYFFANRTSIDCYEKRNKKGYLFLIGDEMAYPNAIKEELTTLIDSGAKKQVPLKEIVAACQKKYNLFFIIPKGTSHYNDPELKKFWQDLIGVENVIMLDKPEAVCETIGLTIGLCEGTTTADGMAIDLTEVGAGKDVIDAATRGLDALAKSVALAKAGTGELPSKKGRSSKTERL